MTEAPRKNLPAAYYKDYGQDIFSYNLNSMLEVLKELNIPPEILGAIREKEEVTFLVLGSATPDNLDAMAQIDRVLRPGQGGQDTVIVIDSNPITFPTHQARIAFLNLWHENARKRSKEGLALSGNHPPYPQFQLTAANMMDLPLSEGAIDIVVSDYTFNFLSTLEEIDRAFAEVARVLSSNGIMLISICGNEKYAHRNCIGPRIKKLVNDPQMKRIGDEKDGVSVARFPLQSYLHIAERHGLKFTVSRFDMLSPNELLLGVLQKS